MLIILFWICFSVIAYTYILYPLVLALIVFIKRFFVHRKKYSDVYEPEVTLFIAAFNEKDIADAKVLNSLELDYPKDKIKFVWVTDGSNDGTPELLKKHSQLLVYHNPERRGKIGAMNRGMKFVKSPIVVFSDANTSLNKNAIREIVNLFRDKTVGCVAGEKRILNSQSDIAVGSGEGFYWKYESFLKRMESEIGSTVGAAGELFAIRSALFEEVEADMINDDFTISLKIAQKGYKIKYAPNAFATESSSANIKEEQKRKIRIAAGSLQTMFRMPRLLNPFKYGFFTFQYFSHKVARWIIVPYMFPILFVINSMITLFASFQYFYFEFLLLQTAFYFLVFLGMIFEKKRITFKIFFVPYYIFVMNLFMIQGMVRYFKGSQSVNWEKVKRADQ